MKYTIQPGKHNDDGILNKFKIIRFGKTMEGTIFLHKNNYYPESQVQNDGKDKVIGFGGLNNKKNSARIASQPDYNRKGIMNFYAYCYLNGERVIQPIISIRTGLKVSYKIEIKSTGYLFTIDNEQTFVEWDGKKPHWRIYDYYHGGHDYAYWQMDANITTKIFTF